MINDRRMLLAHELGITEADMETDLSRIADESRSIRRPLRAKTPTNVA